MLLTEERKCQASNIMSVIMTDVTSKEAMIEMERKTNLLMNVVGAR